MVQPPSTKKKEKYSESEWGIVGTLGSGTTQVRYLQTNLKITKLDKLTLVSDLVGSEKWPVRQLFQRDIDEERVSNGIIPYFCKKDRIKFFNPLTIAVLPTRDHKVLDTVQECEVNDTHPEVQEGYCGVEAEGYYLFEQSSEQSSPWGQFRWNPDKVNLVAIDGQHRLQALKRLKSMEMRDPEDQDLPEDFLDWNVPIIIIINPPSASQLSLLEKTRDIFVTINKEAKKPTRCRTILLNDYSITAMCCQELLDYCHNGGKESIPLMFLDWRATNESPEPQHEVAFLRVEELEDIHLNYLIGGSQGGGELLTPSQRDALFIDDMDPPLDENDLILMRQQIRNQYKKIVMPTILHIFQTIKPFKAYVNHLRKTIKNCKKDYEKHALSKIMYGKHHGDDGIRERIASAESEIIESCKEAKKKIGPLFGKLIGIRGVFSGMTESDPYYGDAYNSSDWESLSHWYSIKINEGIDYGYFPSNSNGLLRHIALDPNGNIIQYKYGQVEKSFGKYCALVACSLDEKISSNTDAIEKLISSLEIIIKRGYKKEVRPAIEEEYYNKSKDEIAELIDNDAGKKTRARIILIKKKLKIS